MLDTDDVNIIRKIKEYLKNPNESIETSGDLDDFYENFRDAIREIKNNQEGKSQLKDAKDWLNEI